jgi:hypothetical protein
MTTETGTFLRRVLAFDAATCAAMGMGLLLGDGHDEIRQLQRHIGQTATG